MPHETPSPIDLHEPELEGSGLGWTFGVIGIASAFLLFANAASLRDWIDDQPPGPVQQQAAEYADQWVETTENFGIGLPHKALHDQWKRVEQARFPGSHRKDETAEPAE